MRSKPWFLLASASSFLLMAASGWAGEVRSGLRPWEEYRTIMWVGDSANQHPEKLRLFFQRLREMGINAAMVYGQADPQPLVDNQFPYYVEGLVNRGLCLKFNSNVRDWDKFVTDWAHAGRSEDGLVRDYCLDDSKWLNSQLEIARAIVRNNREHQPLAYDIRDELSTTISANPFDYDFNPVALTGFRSWLKEQYSTLPALNSEWETDFSSWDEVKPFTTDQIKNRMATGIPIPRGQPDWQEVQQVRFEPRSIGSPTRWNFSPWADFRTYMDVSLARVLDKIRKEAHELDTSTPVGIEGTQMPHAFGGYDLWRLSQVLDWVEPYDIGSAREIFGTFMPGRPILTTVFESETRAAQRRLWHLLLEGDRGCLIWWSEDCIDWKSSDYQLTPKAKALRSALEEMTSPLARLFLRAERERDPIFIHYSQPSIQVDWLMESTVDGSTWLRRFSSFEAEHNRQAKMRTAWLKALQDLGYSPQFLASAEIEAGKLNSTSNTVLVLPASWALSGKEAKAIMSLVRNEQCNCLVFAEGPAGQFDEYGKLRQGRPGADYLEALFTNSACVVVGPDGSFSVNSASAIAYLAARLHTNTAPLWLDWLAQGLRAVPREVSVPASTRARIHRFRLKGGHLLAFERNIEYQMSEDLKQAGGNEALETPGEVEATLAAPGFVYDLSTQMYLGRTNRIRFTLDPWKPSLFAVVREELAPQDVVAQLEKQLSP